MKTVNHIVFRYLTHADFFNIYKPSGTEVGGGGQSYIDFNIGSVSSAQWQKFFSGVPSMTRKQGPSWTFKINSIGLNAVQELTIYQRRPQSFSISSQKITSSQSNRLAAWHPQNGFPQPNDATNRTSCPPKLAIYIVRTDNGEFWAGWFQNSMPCRDKVAENTLKDMLPNSPKQGHAGFITPSTVLHIDESDVATPFFTVAVKVQPVQIPPVVTVSPKPKVAKPTKAKLQRKSRSEEEITKSLFDEDDSYTSEPEDKLKEVIVKVRTRNAKAVQGLKELYKGRCQITGEQFTFVKKDGILYCEAHHLIPLGNEGADSPYNIIIVSPLIHKMLHYAQVSEIDLTQISTDNKLDITINGKTYTITWHPEHANYVKSHQEQ